MVAYIFAIFYDCLMYVGGLHKVVTIGLPWRRTDVGLPWRRADE
jgi:hypothetical protein